MNKARKPSGRIAYTPRGSQASALAHGADGTSAPHFAGGIGGWLSFCTHADKSNSMNTSAFSCGVMPWVMQPVGNGLPARSPDETWMSLNTTRPHILSSSAPTGALNVKYLTDPVS